MITSDELNYLIWRYLQEQGLEISAFALQDETHVDEYDTKYSKRIPLGCLINLIQKGILYCEEDELVTSEGIVEETVAKRFNLFDALEKDKLTNPTTVIDSVENDDEDGRVVGKRAKGNSLDISNGKEPSPSVSETSFTAVMTSSFSFGKSQSNHWNPMSSAVLAWGKRDSSSVIAVLDENNDLKTSLSQLSLEHPSVSFTSSHDITNVRWSDKGDMLLTASVTGELRLWTTDGKLKNVMMLHNLPVIAVKWFNDLVLTKDTKKTIVWDSQSGLAVQHLEDTTGGIDACFIDETKIAVPQSDYSIMVVDLVNNTPLTKLFGHSDNISWLDYSTDLKLLVTASDDLSIRIWKGDSINPIQIMLGHSQIITSVEWLNSKNFSIEGIEMLISTSVDGSIRIWNIFNGDLLFLSTNNDGSSILQAKVSPDSNWIATGDVDGTVTIWDVSIDSLKKNFDAKTGKVGTIKSKSQFQPDLMPDANYISAINWSQDSRKLAVSYSETESVVLCI